MIFNHNFSTMDQLNLFLCHFTASANSETQFVEHAVKQLLKARKVLKCSYVYGYYLDGPGYMKIVFEFMQVSKRSIHLTNVQVPCDIP